MSKKKKEKKKKIKAGMYSVTEYAAETGVSRTIVLRRIVNTLAGTKTTVVLPKGVTAQKVGNDYVIIVS